MQAVKSGVISFVIFFCFRWVISAQDKSADIKPVVYPDTYTAKIDVVYKYVNSPNTRMDIYYPTQSAKPVLVVINIHGGGWNHGNKESQGGFKMYFNQGYAVANVEYRLTGEAKAPAAVEDVRAAMIYLLHHADELNLNKDKIILQGASAGGHLALVAGYLQDNRMYDSDTEPYNQKIKVMAVIDKYGPTKLGNFIYYKSLVNWLSDKATDEEFIKSVSPVDLICSDSPPTYIVHGNADPIVPYSQSVMLRDALEKAGVKHKFTTVPNGKHGKFSNEYNQQIEKEIIQFLNEIDVNKR